MNYHKIEKTSVANGEGVRVVLWVSGCSLHCKGCHNPETWDFNSGKLFDENAEKELFKALSKSHIQGITFSGGHPLEPLNIDVVYELIRKIKKRLPDKDIWLYTGWTLNIDDFCQHNTLELCDVIVDGRYIEELRDLTLKWRGSSNQRVIDVKKTLEKGEFVLYEK